MNFGILLIPIMYTQFDEIDNLDAQTSIYTNFNLLIVVLEKKTNIFRVFTCM